MTGPHRERASILFQQRRFADAEKEMRLGLAEDPNDALGHAVLALCMAAQARVDKAMEEAKKAISLDPDCELGFYLVSMVHCDRENYTDARQAIDEAIRINPMDASYYGQAATISLAQSNWEEARTYAQRGLYYDSDSTECLNALARAQLNLGEKEAAFLAMERALMLDPENPLSHGNMGWLLIRSDQPDKAVEHFRESLRLNPTCPLAKQSILEGLKVRNPIYFRLVKLNLKLIDLSPKTRNICAIIFLTLWFFVVPIRALLVLAFLGMWCAGHFYNLVLRLDPLGSKILTDDDKRTNNIALAVIVISVPLIVLFFWRA